MSISRGIRPDIQALRAIAVLFVVLFHLWPERLPGGFAGVDVFFVISGFLISGSLFEELSSRGRIAIHSFWAKRVRRLLPAAFLVIAVTGLAMAVFVPPFTRSEFAGHGIASLFYFENWNLASSSADYFADSNASPFQHFWSLAVEEQFYVVWPLLLVAASLLAERRFGSRNLNTAWLPALIAIAGSASFIAALALVAADPASSYFNSFLRVWQFALGAAAARWLAGKTISVRLGLLLSCFGFAAILISGFIFTGASGFPGVQALLPTLGAVAVIIGGFTGVSRSQEIAYNLPSVQFFGKVSYSLYLWHWPVIVIAPFILDRALNGIDKLAALLLSIALAWATKALVEDRFRSWPKLVKAKPRATFILAGFTSIVLAVGLILSAGFNTSTQNGAVISLDQAKHDASDVGSKCMTKAEDAEVILCEFGNAGSSYRVLLVGDSHAASQLAGFKKLADERNWALTLAYKAGCSFNLKARNDSPRGISCAAWNKALTEKLSTLPPFNLVVTTSYSNNFLADIKDSNWQTDSAAGFVKAWAPLIARGAKVVALRDNPQMTAAMKKCWDDAVSDASDCKGEKSAMLFPDPSQAAAKQISGAFALDLTDLYCEAETCGAIRNGTYIYRNADHISATYSSVISGVVYQRLQDLLGRGK